MTKKARRTGSKFDEKRGPAGPLNDDAPEFTKEMMDRAFVRRGGVVIRKPRKRGRPLGSGKKVPVYIMLDRDIVASYRLSGRGWQTRINATLRTAVEEEEFGQSSHVDIRTIDEMFNSTRASVDELIVQMQRESAWPAGLPDPRTAFLLFLTKAYKTFQATQLLWRRGFPEDATILFRSNFEILLQVRYLDTNPVVLAKQFTDFYAVQSSKSIRKLRNIDDDVVRKTLQDKHDELNELEAAGEDSQFSLDNTRNWWGGTIHDLAKTKVPSLWNVFALIYPKISEYAHASIGSLFDNVQTRQVKGLAFYPRVSENIVIPRESCLILIDIANTTAKHFLPQESFTRIGTRFDELWKELKSLG